jgi:hypothetical protein
MTTWRALIDDAMSAYQESWSNVVECTLTDTELDVKFDNGYGDEEGKPFTIWTAARVYFPACCDGSEWCASVARNPDGQATTHIGGG